MKAHAIFAMGLALAAAPALASQPGNLMHTNTTMHMQMPGVPAMAPMTHAQTVCVAAKHPDPRDMMRNGSQCHVSNYKLVGNTVSYHVECGGPMPMRGDSTFTLHGDSGFHGVIHMTGNRDGQAMQMDMTIDATRTGSCAYTPPAG